MGSAANTPDPSDLTRLQREVRERAAGGVRRGPDARASHCELCSSTRVRWGALCEDCRLRLSSGPPVSSAPTCETPARQSRRPRRPRPKGSEGRVIAPPLGGLGGGPLGALIQNLPGAIYRCAHDPRRPVAYVSDQILSLTGYTSDHLTSGRLTLADLTHVNDRDRVAGLVAELPPGSSFELEYRLTTSDGGVRWIQDRGQLSMPRPGLAWLDGMLVDVTERRQSQQRLMLMAMRDPLTGLANRRALEAFLASAVESARASGKPLAVIGLDVDHFKRVNDGHGHEVGDLVLKGVAERLGACARASDLVARPGGEEFSWILPDTTLDDAVGVAERARALIAGRPLGDVAVTISAGVAGLEQGGDGAALLAAADGALYEAKAAGRNRVVAAAPG